MSDYLCLCPIRMYYALCREYVVQFIIIYMMNIGNNLGFIIVSWSQNFADPKKAPRTLHKKITKYQNIMIQQCIES